MPTPIEKSASIPQESFAGLQLEIGENTISVLTDPDCNFLRESVKSACAKEYTSENWDFLTDIQALNNKKNIAPQELEAEIEKLMSLYIKENGDKQINISDTQRKWLIDKPNKSVSDFNDAVNEVIKLMKINTLSRPDFKPAFIAAYNKDQVKQNELDSKIALQLNVFHVLGALSDFVTQPLKDFPKQENKSISGRIENWMKEVFRGRAADVQPFGNAQAVARVMQTALTSLVAEADKLSSSDFQDKFDTIIGRNMPIFNKSLLDAVKVFERQPEISETRNQVKAQISTLSEFVADVAKKREVQPSEIAKIKQDLAQRAKAVTSGHETPRREQDSTPQSTPRMQR